MTYLLYLLLVFLYIFGPVFNHLGAWADTIFVVSFLLIIINILKKRDIKPAYANQFYILIGLYIYIAIMVTLQPTVLFSDFLTQLGKPLRILITLFGGFALVKIIFNQYKNNTILKIVEFIFYSIMLHAIIMLLQFQSVEFKDFVYKYTTTGEFRSSFEYNFRMGGLSGGTGGAVLSVVQSIGILLLPFLLKLTNKVWKKIGYLFCGTLIFGSILICGRSGIWSVLLFTPVSIYLSDAKIKFSTIIKLAVISIMAIFLIILVIDYVSTLNTTNPAYYALNRTLDTFISFNQSGKFEDESTTALSDQILFPTNLVTLIAGDAENVINSQYNRSLDSDIGYIRNLWGFGLIGTIIFIRPLYKVLLLSYKERRKYYSAGMLVLITLVMLFFHSKENFLYVRMIFSVYSLLLAFFYLSANNSNYISKKTGL